MVVKAEAAKIIVFMGAEGEQVRDVQVIEGSIQGAVFVFTATADRVAGGNHKIHARSVQLRDNTFLKNADRIIDVADHGKTERLIS